LDKKDLIFGNPKCESRTTNHEARKLFIGPEGGLSDEEIRELEKAGATGISLGRTILRAETAAVALCAIIKDRAAKRRDHNCAL
jgi:RsmE family RNA methyltransferase